MLTGPRKRLPFIGASKADPMLLFDGISLRRGDRQFENVAERRWRADIGGSGLPQERYEAARGHYSLTDFTLLEYLQRPFVSESRLF